MTGSSSGNGRAIAVSPAAEGATVVCSDIRREAREGGYESDANTSTDELITATGGKSQYVRGRRRQLLVDGEPRQHRGKRVRPTRCVCDGQQCRHLHRPAHHRRRKPKTKTTAPCSSTSRAYGWPASSRSGRCCPRTRSTGHGDASSTSPRSEAWSARGRARLLRRQRRRGEPDPPACRRLRRRTHQRQRLIPVLGLCPVAVPVVRGPRCRRRRPKLPLQPSPTASGAWSPQWAATNDEPPRTASTRPLGVNPGLPIREFPNDFAAGGAPRHRNCNVNLDDLDWDRPDLDCKASKRWASLAIFAWTRQCERNVLFG